MIAQWNSKVAVMGMEYLRLGKQAYQTNSLTPVDVSLHYRPLFGKPKQQTEDAKQVKQALVKQAKQLSEELTEVFARLNNMDPPNPDEGYEGENGRHCVQIAKLACRNILEAVKSDGYGGCKLCGNTPKRSFL